MASWCRRFSPEAPAGQGWPEAGRHHHPDRRPRGQRRRRPGFGDRQSASGFDGAAGPDARRQNVQDTTVTVGDRDKVFADLGNQASVENPEEHGDAGEEKLGMAVREVSPQVSAGKLHVGGGVAMASQYAPARLADLQGLQPGLVDRPGISKLAHRQPRTSSMRLSPSSSRAMTWCSRSWIRAVRPNWESTTWAVHCKKLRGVRRLKVNFGRHDSSVPKIHIPLGFLPWIVPKTVSLHYCERRKSVTFPMKVEPAVLISWSKPGTALMRDHSLRCSGIRFARASAAHQRPHLRKELQAGAHKPALHKLHGQQAIEPNRYYRNSAGVDP